MPSLKHGTGSKQRQLLPPLLYFDKFFCPAAFPKTYEQAAVGIYLPPCASAFHPGPFPVACTIFTSTYMCCRKEIFLLEGFILVGRIYPCLKDISFHNITSGLSPLVQHKISFFRQQYNKSLFIFLSFFSLSLCSITDLPLERSNFFCNEHNSTYSGYQITL